MKDIVIAGCLECGAIGDVCLEEFHTAKCYGCGATNFMRQETIGDNMELSFIEAFLEARLKRMELK